MQLTLGIDSAIASARLWALMLRIPGNRVPAFSTPGISVNTPGRTKSDMVFPLAG